MLNLSPADCWVGMGLVLDALGIILLFGFAPEKYPDPQTGVSFALGDRTIRPRWRKMQRIRIWVARSSIAMIVLGFSLQFVGVAFY